MKIKLNNRPILQNLGDGLILCRTSVEDAEALAEFNSRIHSDDGFDKPDLRVAAWTRDLVARPHPTFHPDDCTLVVEAASGKIISSMNLISQTWAYEGIPFGVGRPELVGTLPEYRNRGLVRAQFDEVHKWSALRGELVQGITGIPFYYRLFGYEMGLELSGGRTGYEAQLPKLNQDEGEPFTIRAATEADIPFLMDTYAQSCRRRLVTCVRDESIWRYDLGGQSRENVERLEFRILERAGYERNGWLLHPSVVRLGHRSHCKPLRTEAGCFLAGGDPLCGTLLMADRGYHFQTGRQTRSTHHLQLLVRERASVLRSIPRATAASA